MTELETLRRHFADRPGDVAARHTNVIVVAAGKGGVGTSTVAALLAAAYARAGQDTLLVAADGSAGGLTALLGVAVDASATEPALAPIGPQLALALATSGRSEAAGEIERRALFRRVSSLFAAHDTVIIDAGARFETITSTLASAATELLVVAAPDRVTLAASYALLKVAAARAPHVRATVLINRAGDAESVAAYRSLRTGAERFLDRVPAYGGAIADEAALRYAVDERRLLQTELAAMHTLARLARRRGAPRLRIT